MDENSLENLSGPVPAPAPLGESAPITTGNFGTDFQRLATTLTGVGKQGIVSPAIGNGNGTEVIPTISSGDMAGPEEAFIPDSSTVSQDFAEGGKKAKRQQRRADRKARGGAFASGRQEDKAARQRSWNASKGLSVGLGESSIRDV